MENPENYQLTHSIKTKDNSTLNQKELMEFGVSKEDMEMMYYFYYIPLTTTQIETLSTNPFVEVEPLEDNPILQSNPQVTKYLCKLFIHPDIYDKTAFLSQAGLDSIDLKQLTNYATLPLSKEIIEKIKTLPYVEEISPVITKKGWRDESMFPHSEDLNWNNDFYGPITIPKKGMKILLTEENLKYYERVIKVFEKEEVRLNEEYTFKMDYYFMMGDNRHNSADSRYWGFVPEDHIVGKASVVWLSFNKDQNSILKKIRWNRIFKNVN
ncbi:MAG: signal peptidase I [Bacteroidales bacterium]|nr:signal peptidase I [Bacteroidales bacterium]